MLMILFKINEVSISDIVVEIGSEGFKYSSILERVCIYVYVYIH